MFKRLTVSFWLILIIGGLLISACINTSQYIGVDKDYWPWMSIIFGGCWGLVWYCIYLNNTEDKRYDK